MYPTVKNRNVIVTKKTFKKFYHAFLNCEDRILAVDTETTGVEYTDKIRGISCAFKDHAFYVPFDSFAEIGRGLTIKEVAPITNKFFEKARVIVYHNFKFDNFHLRTNGMHTPMAKMADTMLISHHLGKIGKETGLKERTREDLGLEMDNYDPDMPYKKFCIYAIHDAIATLMLFHLYLPFVKERKLENILKLDFRVAEVVDHLQAEGVKVDVPMLKDVESRVTRTLCDRRDDLEDYIASQLQKKGVTWEDVMDKAGKTKVMKRTGERRVPPLNVNSSQHIAFIYDALGTSYPLTDSGNPSLGAPVLFEKALKGNKIAKKMLSCREVGMLASTFTTPILKGLDKYGYMHGSINMHIVRTSRFSASNPNMQNLPTNTEFNIRECFIPEEDEFMLVADYSQIELRVLTHYTQDKILMENYLNDGDLHAVTANLLKVDRAPAKTVNFLVIYGGGPGTLQRNVFRATGIKPSFRFCDDLIDGYFETYRGVDRWIKGVHRAARQEGGVRTITGRWRDLRAEYGRYVDGANRMAVNTIVQSGAGEIIKRAMVNIFNDKSCAHFAPKIRMNIHDELVITGKKQYAEEARVKIKGLMENAFKLSIPLKVDAKLVENWGEMKG